MEAFCSGSDVARRVRSLHRSREVLTPDEAAPIDLAADGSDRAGIGVRLDNASRQMDKDELTLTDVLVG
jgi:hypothetical protein